MKKSIIIDNKTRNLELIGELVLVISPNLKKLRNYTLGLFSGMISYLDDEFILIDPAFFLKLPFKKLERKENCKYNISHKRVGIEFYSGIEDIVEKLKNEEGYQDYANWISQLKKPYSFD